MPVEVVCTCGARLRVRDDAAGRRTRCPKCGQGVPVPRRAPETPVEPCPSCQAPNPETAGFCGGCGVPLREVEPAPPPPASLRDLRMEAHVHAIAVWYCAGSSLGLVVLLTALSGMFGVAVDASRVVVQLGCCFAMLGSGIFLALWNPAARLGAAIVAGLIAFVFLVAIVVGLGTVTNRTMGLVGFICVFCLVIATYFGAVLITLIRKEAARLFEPEYQQLVAASPDLRPSLFRSPFFYVPAGLLLVGVGSTAVWIG